MSDLRIGGLASGMDIDSIVEDMMTAERIPLEKLKQEKQILEWKKEDYLDINKALKELKDQVFELKLQSTFDAKTATSSNEDSVEVTAGSSAVAGTYTVTVHQLAEGVFKASTGELSDETNGDSTKSLYEQFQTQFDNRGLTDADDISFTLNGQDFTFNLGEDNIYNVVSEINDADLGVTASYDSDLNRFFLTTTETGSSAQIEVTGDSADFIANGTDGSVGGSDYTSILKLDLTEGTAAAGQDAVYDFGDAAGLTSSTNSATVNGITLDFKQAGGSTSTITVKNDTEAVFEKIKGFVEKYNETLERVTDELLEKRYRDYPPLTDKQKEDMTEKQIELWEEKAKSGLLRNDRILNDVANEMRMTMSGIVSGLSGEYDSLDDIGIYSLSWEDFGQLTIDEDKLREAIENDPEGIKQLFTNSSDNEDEKGIAEKLYDELDESIDTIADKAGIVTDLVDNSTMGKKIREMNERIDEWEDRLIETENRYWQEFTAMEKAINQMNMQSAWLAQQFGGSGMM